MSNKYVLYEKKDGIGIVQMSNPEKRNAHSAGMTEGLSQAFADMGSDPEVRVAILTGDPAGGAFSAGADIQDMTTHNVMAVGENLAAISPGGNRGFDSVVDFPKPVIAAINGYSIGWGCIIALCCDFLISSDRAEFSIPNGSLGIIPAYGGSLRLAQFVGKGNAMRLILTSERIKAHEALRIGLVTEVVTHEELMPRALELAGRMADMPPLGLKLTKESLNRGLDASSVKEASHADQYRSLTLYLTEDRFEAHQAWREKRKPQFKGR